MNEPHPADPSWSRYSTTPFPRYRYVPGMSPHPRRDPAGHSFGLPELPPPPVVPERWRECETYLYGIDLYNFAYWWECHESLESLWHVVGHETIQGQFLQGIIQVSAANLQRFRGSADAARWLALRGIERLSRAKGTYMGLEVERFAFEVRDHFEGRRDLPALISLRD